MDRVLLVEGISDKRVVQSLCHRLGITQSFSITNKEGLDPLLKSISLELKAPDREVVGMVIDANEDIAARWQSVADRIRSAGIDPPENPDRSGTVIEGSPRVGVWLMPDNCSPGELEDFVAKMIPDSDPLWPRAQEYIDDIPEGLRKFSPNKASRAKLYAWFATRKSPRQMGQAIRTGDLDAGHDLAASFAGWLTRTFEQ